MDGYSITMYRHIDKNTTESSTSMCTAMCRPMPYYDINAGRTHDSDLQSSGYSQLTINQNPVCAAGIQYIAYLSRPIPPQRSYPGLWRFPTRTPGMREHGGPHPSLDFRILSCSQACRTDAQDDNYNRPYRDGQAREGRASSRVM